MVMPNGDPLDGFLYPTLTLMTLMMDSYNNNNQLKAILGLLQIAFRKETRYLFCRGMFAISTFHCHKRRRMGDLPYDAHLFTLRFSKMIRIQMSIRAFGKWLIKFTTYKYCKTCLKRSLKNRQNKYLNDKW